MPERFAMNKDVSCFLSLCSKIEATMAMKKAMEGF
jgi:hypothetical protein